MQVLPRWRNLLLFKNSTHLASFHSTPTSFKKLNSSYIRIETRQKRAGAKTTLMNNLLSSIGCSKISSKITFEEVLKTEYKNTWDGGQGDHTDSVRKKCRSKSSARHATRACNNGRKSKYRRDGYFEDFDDYEATVRNKRYTRSSKRWGKSSFQSSTSGFEWREHPNWTNGRFNAWGTASEFKSANSRNYKWDPASETWSDGKSCLGSFSDRKLLGLPLNGPLKIEEVKTAFRSSALKWHPDKHQGSSQATAEENFKYCVDAYKSLCNALASS